MYTFKCVPKTSGQSRHSYDNTGVVEGADIQYIVHVNHQLQLNES